MATKEFDCIAFKRNAALRIFEATKGMTREEELAYWKVREEALRRRLQTQRTGDGEETSSNA